MPRRHPGRGRIVCCVIFKSLDRLQQILVEHQDLIFKRWSKRTRAAREDVLLEAWPDIPLTHRPDFALFHRFETLQYPVSDPHELIAAKFPWLNPEDLSQGKTFLMLLDARARNAPKKFARSDLQASVMSRAGQVRFYFYVRNSKVGIWFENSETLI